MPASDEARSSSSGATATTGATKPVPTPVETVVMYVLAILADPERLANADTVEGRVRLFHDRVRPESVHQLLFRDEPACVPDQDTRRNRTSWGSREPACPPAAGAQMVGIRAGTIRTRRTDDAEGTSIIPGPCFRRAPTIAESHPPYDTACKSNPSLRNDSTSASLTSLLGDFFDFSILTLRTVHEPTPTVR